METNHTPTTSGSITDQKMTTSKPNSVRLTSAESDRLVNRLKNTNLDKFHTLCKMHLSFLLHLPGSHLDDFLDGRSADQHTTGSATPGSTPGSVGGSSSGVQTSEKSKLSFKSFGKRKQKDTRSPGSLNKEVIDQILTLVEHLSQTENLQQEGLFRKSGHIGRQKLLREKLQHGEDIHLELEQAVYSAHDCANVLKSCLSDLPEPILTEKLYSAYCQVSQMEQPHKQLQTIQLLLQLLPAENLFLLKSLLTLLFKVSSEPQSKMSAESLGTLFVPHLLVPRQTKAHDLQEKVGDLTRILGVMIQQSRQTFKLPSALIRDIATYWSDMEHSTDAASNTPTEHTRRFVKRPADALQPIRTSVTFTDREASQNASLDTQTAVAELYAHVSALPQSAKRRRLVKQFNRATGVVSPFPSSKDGNTPRSETKRHKRTKSLGDSIKKMVGKNHRRSGSAHKLRLMEVEEHYSYKPVPVPPTLKTPPTPRIPTCETPRVVKQTRPAPTKPSLTPAVSKFHASSHKKPITHRPVTVHIVDLKDSTSRITPVSRTRHGDDSKRYHGDVHSVKARVLERRAPEGDKENQGPWPGACLSPIGRSVSKAPRNIQTSIMTPGSRTPVAMLMTP